MNVFEEMGLSIYSYGSYSQFLKNKKSKVFGFGVLLVFFYFAVKMLFPAAVNSGFFSRESQTVWESIPDFVLEDGTLWVEDVIEIDEGGAYLYINTDNDLVFNDTDDIARYFYGYQSVILMDSEKVIFKSNNDVVGYYYSDLGLEYSREDLAKVIPWIYVFYIIYLILAYIWMTALFFFGVLFIALIGMIIASCMNYHLTFGQLYLIGIYSRTLPLLIKAVVSLLPISFSFFWIINFGLSLFIMAMAIQKMKEQQPDKPMEFTSSGFDM